MPKKYGNRIKVNSATTGTGLISLGTAVEGYQNFSSGGITDGSSVSYVIEDGANFEIGVGTYTASGTTLSRTVSESTNSNNAINLSGEAVIFITPAASDLPFTDGASFSGAVTFAEDVTFDGATAGYDIVFDRSDNALEFADNAKARFGTGNDLEVYHASNSSYIDEVGGGSLFIRTNGFNVFIGKTTGSEYMAVFTPDGAVSLRYDNATKFETTSTGINVTGTVTDDGAVHDGDVTFTGASYSAVWDKSQNSLEFADNARATFGTSRDLQIHHNGASLIENYSGNLSIINYADDADVRIQTDNGQGNIVTYLQADGSTGQVQLTHYGNTKFSTETSGVSVTGNIAVSGTVDARDLAVDGSKLDGITAGADVTPSWVPSSNPGYISYTGGVFSGATRFNDSVPLRFGTGNDLTVIHNGTDSLIENSTGDLYIKNDANDKSVIIQTDDNFGNLTNYFKADGVSAVVRLYSGGVEKVRTNGSGILVSGDITVTGDIENTTGDMTVDVAGDLALDVGGATIFFKDDGATWGYIENQTTDGAFDIKSSTNNYDMRFRGTDNGSTITALTLDMSNAGAATFNDDVKLSDYKRVNLGNGGDLQLLHDGGGTSHISNYTGHLYISNYSDDADIKIQTDNGQGNVTDYILADGSDGSVHLMHYGSTKLQTINTGVSVSGNVTVTGTVAATAVTGDGSGLTNLPSSFPASGGTFTGDVTFSGTNHSGVTWDTSSDEFLFAEGSRIDFGGGANIRRESDGILRITGATASNTYFNFSNNLIFYRGGSAAAQMMIDGSTQRFHAYGNITVGGTVDGVDIATNIPSTLGSAGQVLTVNSGGTAGEWADVSSASSNVGTGNFIGGTNAGAALQSGGTYNTLLGNSAGDKITTGDRNVAIGFNPMGTTAAVTGSDNVGIGHDALEDISSGSYNVGIGRNAGANITTANANVFLGYDAGQSATTGGYNVALGLEAAHNLSSGYNNVALGYRSGWYISTGFRNVAIGTDVMQGSSAGSVSGYDNIGMGNGSLHDLTSGHNNVALGNQTAKLLTTGTYNVAIGTEALQSITTEEYCTAVGNAAGSSNTGANNTSFGAFALQKQGTGTDNAAFGASALGGLSFNNFSRTTAVGANAGNRNTGNDNVYVGYNSGYSATSGTNSTFVGRNSGNAVTTGSKNTILGNFNGNQGGLDIRTSSNNIVLSDGDGNPRLRVDSSGHVGIGTNSPTGTLDVAQSGSHEVLVRTTSTGDPTITLQADGQNNGKISYSRSGEALIFNNSGAERMRIDSSGHAIIPAGVTLGTSAGTYAAANTLDDYEEGTWTPYYAGATGITHTVQSGTYVKVGDLVTLWWRIDYTGTMGGSNIRIAGRPFYQYTHDTSMNIGALGARSALNVGANDVFFPAMYSTADAIYIYTTSFGALNYTSVWQAGSLTGTLTYRAN